MNSRSCTSGGSRRNWRLWIVTTCSRRALPSPSLFQTSLPALALRPAALVDLDRSPRAHHVLEQQREAEPDRAAARDRHSQHRRGRLGRLLLLLPLGRFLDRIHALDGRPQVSRGLEPKQLVADRDLVTRLQRPGGHRRAVDQGAVAAAAVVQDVAAGLLAYLGVVARGRRVGQDDVVVIAAPERDRPVTNREPPACLTSRQTDNAGTHRIGSRTPPAPRLPSRYRRPGRKSPDRKTIRGKKALRGLSAHLPGNSGVRAGHFPARGHTRS